MDKKQEFTPIHFESAIYWGVINNTEDLKNLFKAYEGTYTKKEILSLARAKVLKGLGEDEQSYAIGKGEHTGKTLESYLQEQGVVC